MYVNCVSVLLTFATKMWSEVESNELHLLALL